MLLRRGQRLLAVGGLQQLVAVDAEPRDQDVAIGLVVVDDQDTRWIVHDERNSKCYLRYSLIFASN